MNLLSEHPEISSYLENIIGEVFDIRTISDIHAAFAHDISRHFGKTVLKWGK